MLHGTNFICLHIVHGKNRLCFPRLLVLYVLIVIYPFCVLTYDKCHLIAAMHAHLKQQLLPTMLGTLLGNLCVLLISQFSQAETYFFRNEKNKSLRDYVTSLKTN